MAKSTGGTRSGSSNNPTGTGAPSSGVTVEYLRNNIGSSRQRLAELENSGQGESVEARNLRVGIRLAEQMLERRGAAVNVSRNISQPRNMSFSGRVDSIVRRMATTKEYEDMSVRELQSKLNATHRAIGNIDTMEALTQSDEAKKQSAKDTLAQWARELREEINKRNR